MQGRSSYIGKGVVACLAILGGAGLGGLAAGLNARLAVSPQPSPAVLAAVAEMAPSETVNLRFPADWSDAAAEAAPQVVMAAMASSQKGDAAPRRMVLASADSGMVLLSPRPTYPVTAEVPDAAEPPAKPKPAPQQAAAPAPKPVAKPPRSNTVLNDAQIASIKRRLNLTPDQERYWPAVEAELRKMEYAKRAAGGSRTASVDMSKVNVEGLKSAGYPLVMSFSDDQRRELKSLAHLLGLESVMAGL
jgi:hypothetical protein